MAKKINYTGSNKVIKRICEAVNDLIDNSQTPPTVEVTQVLQSGELIAQITVGTSVTNIYAPSSANSNTVNP